GARGGGADMAAAAVPERPRDDRPGAATTGVLLGRRIRGEALGVGLVSVGDGATSTGSFHEGVNLAAVERLPLVVVVANNLYAYSTPNHRQFACSNLIERAAGYGVKGWEADGSDLEDCLTKVAGAIRTARQSGEPQLVVATLLRLSGHGEHDDASYVDPAVHELATSRDCLAVAEETILTRNWAGWGDLLEWKEEAKAEIEATIITAQQEPAPDPFEEKWCALSTLDLFEGYGAD
ncbi:MAG: thiamine pyrophosphate-dependent enzyme, partial [Verrucomicrobiia bacterium]